MLVYIQRLFLINKYSNVTLFHTFDKRSNVCWYINTFDLNCKVVQTKTKLIFNSLTWNNSTSCFPDDFSMRFFTLAALCKLNENYQTIQDCCSKLKSKKNNEMKYITNFITHSPSAMLYYWLRKILEPQMWSVAALLSSLLLQSSTKYLKRFSFWQTLYQHLLNQTFGFFLPGKRFEHLADWKQFRSSEKWYFVSEKRTKWKCLTRKLLMRFNLPLLYN